MPPIGVEFVQEIDGVEEPDRVPGPDSRPSDSDGEMGLAGSVATDQHEVVPMVEEIADCLIADQGLVDLRHLEVELIQLLCLGQLGDGYLEFDRPGLLHAWVCECSIGNIIRFRCRLDTIDRHRNSSKTRNATRSRDPNMHASRTRIHHKPLIYKINRHHLSRGRRRLSAVLRSGSSLPGNLTLRR